MNLEIVVPVDSVQCYYFSLKPINDVIEWETLCERITEAISGLSNGYLWHKDKLKVLMPVVTNTEPVHFLSSTTCFGDNIDDEWFIVYMIFEITKLIPDLVVQVIDEDGDFLLIEAAEYLPKWMNPTTTTNRVFIYNGTIHLINTDLVNTESPVQITDALQLIAKDPNKTIAHAEIQKAITKKTSVFPTKIKENLHSAIVSLPLDLAALLSLRPELISSIVNTYCHRDILDEKQCKNLDIGKTICVKVTFTKCLYAMIMHSTLIKHMPLKFQSDKKSLLGLKLLCGYKILQGETSDIYQSKQFNKFLENLNKHGYFKDNIPDSKEYTNLLEKAKCVYLETVCPRNKHVSSEIKNVMATDLFLKHRDTLKDYTGAEDNDDWLTIDPQQLEQTLNSRYGKKEKKDLLPSSMTNKLESFLCQSSDYEGIEIKNSESDQISFDPDEFSLAIEKMLKIANSTDALSDSNSSDDDFSNDEDAEDDDDIDVEIRKSLASVIANGESNDISQTTHKNLLQSLREEQSHLGPSSNLLNSIGVNKNWVLDSDDDE